jgi:hypothetical protein
MAKSQAPLNRSWLVPCDRSSPYNGRVSPAVAPARSQAHVPVQGIPQPFSKAWTRLPYASICWLSSEARVLWRYISRFGSCATSDAILERSQRPGKLSLLPSLRYHKLDGCVHRGEAGDLWYR